MTSEAVDCRGSRNYYKETQKYIFEVFIPIISKSNHECTGQKIKFSIEDLVAFIEEILTGKRLPSDGCLNIN